MAVKRPCDDLILSESPAKIQKTQQEAVDDLSSQSPLMPDLLELIAQADGVRILRAEEDDGSKVTVHDCVVIMIISSASLIQIRLRLCFLKLQMSSRQWPTKTRFYFPETTW